MRPPDGPAPGPDIDPGLATDRCADPPPPPSRPRRALALAGELLARTTDLLAPRDCPCGAEGAWLCADCAELLHARPTRVEDGCDALQVLVAARVREEITQSGGSLPAGVDLAPLLPVLALGEYAGDLQHLVLAWKNGGRAHLARPLAAGLAPAVAALLATAGEDPDVADPADGVDVDLVPVPSRRAARLRRGEDHTGELVRELERRGAGRALLLRARPTTGQEGQGRRRRRERRIELAAAGRGGRSLSGRRVVVVDDVVTTGATLRAMHEALTGAGAEVLGAVVVAASRLPAAPRTG